MPLVVGFSCGVVFALGLGISRLTRPEVIRGFLDFFGAWNPTMLVTLVTGLAVYAAAHGLARRWERPVLLARFAWPRDDGPDARLVVGSVVFGAGWGMAGLCPGPAVTVAAFSLPGAWFLLGVVAGIAVLHLLDRRPLPAGQRA
jgi:uncharacterized protein